MILEQKGIPSHAIKAAKKTLEKYAKRLIPARQIHAGNCGGEALSVGIHYRLYRNGKEGTWRLMSHERYNIFAKGRRL